MSSTYYRSLLPLFVLFLFGLPASAQWTFVSTGSYQTTDVALLDDVFIVSCDDSICGAAFYISTDGGSTWSPWTDFEGTGRNVVALGDGFVAQRNGNHDYTVSADGSTWTGVAGLGANTTSYFFDEADGRLYATTQSQNLVYSDDGGSTWTSAAVPNPRDGELTFVHVRGQKILTGYNQGGAYAYLSTDGGANWTELDRLTPKGGFIGDDGDLYIAQNVNVGLVTPSTALLRSTDEGQTWTQLHVAPGVGFQGRSTPLRVRTSIYAVGSSILYTANDLVFVSTDDGATWEDKSDGITPNDVNATAAVQFVATADTAYMVLYSSRGQGSNAGYGLYKRALSELGLDTQTSTDPLALPPAAFALESTYPNPFRQQTQLRYTLTQPGHVRLSVYDMLGREVAVLMEGPRPAGAFEQTWRATGLPSGAYLVRLTRQGRSETRRVTLVK